MGVLLYVCYLFEKQVKHPFLLSKYLINRTEGCQEMNQGTGLENDHFKSVRAEEENRKELFAWAVFRVSF
jgi:hypothetical protein